MEFNIIDEGFLENEKNFKNGLERIFIFGVFEGEEKTFLKNKSLKKFDFINKIIKEKDFVPKNGKTILLQHPVLSLVFGLGEKEKFFQELRWMPGIILHDSLRVFISASLRVAKENNIKEATFIIPGFKEKFHSEKGLFYMGAGIVEGAQLGLYEFKKYFSKKNEKNKKDIENINVFFEGAVNTNKTAKNIEKGFEFGKLTSRATNFARDLANEPGNVITPSSLANVAKGIADKNKNIKCEIFGEKQIINKGMNAFYGVARGSKNPPRFIHLTYKPALKGKNKTLKKIALVGKGITFDSGGLSLKPADYMTNMKSDKSGACAVLGIMKYISELSPHLEVHGIIAACENMPDGGAQRPDDIVKALNGKTIEIENTDAEGRLTLADALSFAVNLRVDEIIDMATLTGACVVALGEYTSGVMGNNNDLIEKIIKASGISGERMWELPFDDNMKEKLSSPVADLKNVGNRYGGAITAGMFLQEFVQGNVKWCHIDIAGPAFTKTGFLYNPKGATGAGVRTMLYYLEQH